MVFNSLESMLTIHLTATVCVAVMGFMICAARNTDTRRNTFIGWLTYATTVGGFFAGGFQVWHFAPPTSKEYIACAFGGGGFGFLFGLAFGRFLWRYYRKEIEAEGDGDGE